MMRSFVLLLVLLDLTTARNLPNQQRKLLFGDVDRRSAYEPYVAIDVTPDVCTVSFNGYEAAFQCNQKTPMNILTNAYDTLKANNNRFRPKNFKVVVTAPPARFTSADVEKFAYLLFQTFNAPAFYMTSKSELALLNTGSNSGIVVDCLHYDKCVVVSVVNGTPCSVKDMGLGAQSVDDYMEDYLLNKYGYGEHSLQFVDAIKKIAYVRMSPNDIMHPELFPAGVPTTHSIGEVRLAYEILFDSLTADESLSLSDTVYHSTMQCNFDDRGDYLYNNIVITTGAKFPWVSGLSERLTAEIVALAPSSDRVNVQSAEEVSDPYAILFVEELDALWTKNAV